MRRDHVVDIGAFIVRARTRAREIDADVQRFSTRVRDLVERRTLIEHTAHRASESDPHVGLRHELAANNEALQIAEEELRAQVEELTRVREALEETRLKYVELFDDAPEAYVVTNDKGVIREANVAAGELLGVPQAYLRGKPLLYFVARQDTRAFRAVVNALPTSASARRMRVRIRPRHSPPISAVVSVAPVRSAAPGRGALRWILRRAADDDRDAALVAAENAVERIRRLQNVTAYLSRAATVAEVAQVVVDHGIEALGASSGAVRRASADGASLTVVASIGVPHDVAEATRTVAVGASMPACDAVRAASALFVESAEELDARYPHLAATYERTRRGGVVAVPLLHEGRVLGVMELTFAGARCFDEDERALMIALARQCAHAFERARLYDAEQKARRAAQEAERRARLLADLGASLAEPVGARTIVAALASFLTLRIGDFCVIDVIDGDVVRRTASAATDARAALARRFEELHRADGCASIVATRAHRAIVRELRVRAHVRLPLVARGVVVGSILVARRHTRFDATERALVQEIATRAALHVDHALLYERERAAVRARDDVMAIVSHDLRNPLAAIVAGAAALGLRLTGSGDEVALRILAAVRRNAQRMIDLARDLSDVAQIEHGALELSFERCSPLALLRDAAESSADLAASRSVGIVIDCAPDLWVTADPRRVAQVIANLLGNAIKFSPTSGQISFSVRPRGDELLFVIEDEGPGIAPDAIVRVFDRHWTAGPRESRSGTGLGLWIAKSIVSRHGGTIWAERRSPRGTRVCFTLRRERRA